MTRAVPWIWALTVAEFVALSMLAQNSARGLVGSGVLTALPLGSQMPDLSRVGEFALYQSAFSGWVALFLAIPAFATVWVRDASPYVWHFWLSHWTLGSVAYVVHVVMGWVLLFEADVTETVQSLDPLVLWFGLMFCVWWPLDAALAIMSRSAPWVEYQRNALVVAITICIFCGYVIEGVLWPAQLIGYSATFAVAASGIYVWWARRR